MTKVRRVDFYPDDFMVGVIGMPPDEIGAYWVACSLIYSHGGPIDDDPAWLATACNCHQRTWKRLRAELIRRGKLFEVGGKLTNTRAEKELNRARTRTEKARNNGRTGGRPRAESNNNNGIEQPDGSSNEKLSYNKQQPTISKQQSSSQQDAAPPLDGGPSRVQGSGRSAQLSSPSGVPSPQTTASPSTGKPTRADPVRMQTDQLEAGAVPPSAEEIDRVGFAACEAAGLDPGQLAIDFAIVGNWLRAGYDAEREILPAIRSVVARSSYAKPSSLRYFHRAIADFRATLRAPMPKGEARSGPGGQAKREWWEKEGPAEGTPEWWDARLALWVQHRHRAPKDRPWDDHWGPQPDEPKCRAPGEILAKHGVRKAA